MYDFPAEIGKLEYLRCLLGVLPDALLVLYCCVLCVDFLTISCLAKIKLYIGKTDSILT